mgnify:CR=1 FL=1
MTREEHILNLETIGCDGWNVSAKAKESLEWAISKLKENKGEDRPKGEWKRKVHYLDICWECSNCGHNSNYYSPLYNFCPDCGADMRGE